MSPATSRSAMSSQSRSHSGRVVISTRLRVWTTVRAGASCAAGSTIAATANVRPAAAERKTQPSAVGVATLTPIRYNATKARSSPVAAPATPVTAASTAGFKSVSTKVAPRMRRSACSRIRRARPAPAIAAATQTAATTPGAPGSRNNAPACTGARRDPRGRRRKTGPTNADLVAHARVQVRRGLAEQNRSIEAAAEERDLVGKGREIVWRYTDRLAGSGHLLRIAGFGGEAVDLGILDRSHRLCDAGLVKHRLDRRPVDSWRQLHLPVARHVAVRAPSPRLRRSNY